MPTARTRANRKYNEKAYDRLAITIPKGRKTAVEAAARERGESVNGMVNAALMGILGLTDAEWNARPAQGEDE